MHKLYESLSETGNTFGKRRRLYWSIFEEIDLMLPPRREQTKIAAILTSVDEAIEATRAVIDQLQVVKKALMGELLTRGLPGRHTRFKQTEIGELPETWSVVSLAELVELQPGFAFKSNDFCIVGDRLLRGSNVGVGSLDWSPSKTVFFPEERRADFAEYALKVDDIVVAMDRPFISDGFKIARVSEADLPSLLLQRVGRFRRYRADREFVWALLHSDFVQGHLRVQQKGTDLPHISKGEIEASRVPCPPVDEQVNVGVSLAQFDSRLGIERATCSALRDLRSALMSVLLTGEVRVKPDSEPA
jgi:type I restriction enzyme, S subunit